MSSANYSPTGAVYGPAARALARPEVAAKDGADTEGEADTKRAPVVQEGVEVVEWPADMSTPVGEEFDPSWTVNKQPVPCFV